MITAVLCGGSGGRLLGDNPDVLQKCCVEVAGRPFLHWRIEQLLRCGYTDLHFITKGRYAAEVKMVVGDYPVHIEDISGNKFQAASYAAELGKNDTVCVVNGDTWMDIPPYYDSVHQTPLMLLVPPFEGHPPNVCMRSATPNYLDAGVYWINNEWPQIWEYMVRIGERPYHLNTPKDKVELDAHLRRYSESK
jgi:molybdopterin-guanine dinucleotide biosynthesis protein A